MSASETQHFINRQKTLGFAHAQPNLQSKQPSELYYWHREERNSNAEVDFLFLLNGKIIPVEVKAGKKGTLKSLHLFLASHPHSAFGIKISEQPYEEHFPLISYPMYGIEGLVSQGVDL